MKNKFLVFGIMSLLLLIPFALATDTGDAITSIGALAFVGLLAVCFLVSGGVLLSKSKSR